MIGGRLRRVGRLVRSPKGVLLLVLLGLAGIAAPSQGVTRVAPWILGAVGGAAAVDILLTWIGRRVVILPEGALLSGLLIGLVLGPGVPWYVPAAAGAAATSTKYLLRTSQAHVFNPAALALLASAYLFSAGQSWWGALADLPAPSVALLVVGGFLVAARVHKLPAVLAFTGSYFTIFTLAAVLFSGGTPRIAEAFRVPFVNAALFFAFFMLTDPPTSPGRAEEQVPFGAIVGVVSAIAFLLVQGITFLFLGLLAGNAWHGWRRAMAESALSRTAAAP